MAGSGTYTTYNSDGSVKNVQTATQYHASNAAAISSGQDTPIGVGGTIVQVPITAASTPASPTTLYYGTSPTGQPVYESSKPGGTVNPSQAIPAPYSSGGNPTPAPSPVAPIANPTFPPANVGTPTLPIPQAPNVADQFNQSLATQLQAQQAQLQQALQTQQANYQTKIDALNKQQSDVQTMMDTGLASENSTMQQEVTQKQQALQTEQQQFQASYDAKTALISEMNGLLTTGNQVIQQMKDTTGLSSIMSPRISQTMSDVTARAGVIQTLLSAYDGQIGVAQSQLKTTVDTITSIATDQINYYQNVISFYSSQEAKNATLLATLTNDQQKYVDAQISQLQDQVKNTQATADLITKAMLDPTTALAYNKAGVSLTDTPAQINYKLSMYEQAQQNVWGTPVLKGGDYIQTNKVTGETRTVVSNVSNPSSPTNLNGQNYSRGTMGAKQFVELSVQRAGLTYEQALAKIPAGKVGVVDNATGQIGYIDNTEYNTKQYTYL